MAEFLVPINFVVRIKNIPEEELEDYIAGAQVGLYEMFYSDDSDDDHYEVEKSSVQWNQIKEV